MEERVFLLLLLDPATSPPSGGTVVGYATVRVAAGGLNGRTVGDVSLLDAKYLRVDRPVALQANGTDGSLRERLTLSRSAVSPDLPTWAPIAADLAVAEGAADRVDVVIVLTPELARRILLALGPVAIRQLGVTLTPDNVVALTTHYVSEPRGHVELVGAAGDGEPMVKSFVALVLGGLRTKLSAQTIVLLPEVARAFTAAAESNDIRVYFRAASLQDVVLRIGVAGKTTRVQAPAS